MNALPDAPATLSKVPANDEAMSSSEIGQMFTNSILSARLPLPLEALPSKTRELIKLYKAEMDRASDELILAVLLSTVSFVTASRSVVQCPERGTEIPPHMFLLTIAPTGAGKSTVTRFIQKPLANGLEKALEGLHVEVEVDDFDTEVRAPVDKYSADPVLNEATMKGIMRHMHDHDVALFNNPDAAGFLGGYSFKEEPDAICSMLCQIWSGESNNSKRSDSKNDLYIEDPCMAMNLMIQEAPAASFYASEAAQSIGVHARLLPLVAPPPKDVELRDKSSRISAMLSLANTGPARIDDTIKAFHDRLRDATAQYVLRANSTSDFDPLVIGVRQTAEDLGVYCDYQEKWVGWTNNPEMYRGNGMLNRLMEHTLRIACALAWIEGEPEITGDLLRSAAVLAEHFLDQYEVIRTSTFADADAGASGAVWEKLEKIKDERGLEAITVLALQKSYSDRARPKVAELDKTLHQLAREGAISLDYAGAEKGFSQKTIISFKIE
jgi:hypothetical protein